MKIKIILFFLLFISLNTFAQICGTTENNLRKTIDTQSSCYPIDYSNKGNNATYYIKIKFHFLRDNGGTLGNPNLDRINNITSYLNSKFSQHGINIVGNGYDYINNTNYYNQTIGGSNCDNLRLLSDDPNSINIYVVKTINAPFTIYTGSKYIFISQSSFSNNNQTITHELGHALYLKHTHDTYNCAELINGSNCNTCGDLICDTPADNGTGANNGYNPDLTNIMSYYVDYDRNHFTSGQGLRMRNYIEYGIGEIRTNFTPYLQGCSLGFCVDESVYYKLIGNNTNATVTWTKSANLSITSSSNNAIAIKGLTEGGGWITYVFNGVSRTTNVYIGRPTNITATPYSYGYTIGFSPAVSCSMEFVDLVNNSSGTTQVSSGLGGNFFYYVPLNHSFKFRLTTSGGCQQPSDWITVVPIQCPANNYPSNLVLTSQCGNCPGIYPNSAGAIVRWDSVSGSTGYQYEYLIYNLIGQSKTGGNACSSNSFTFGDSVSSLGSGPWYVKFRVKSKCINNTWSDYSPYSISTIWSPN